MRSAAGSISKLDSGRWKVTVSAGHDAKTGKRTRKSKTIRGTRRDAELLRAQMILNDVPQDITLAEAVRAYLRDKEGRVRVNTLQGYRKDAQKLLACPFALCPLRGIREKDAQEIVNTQDTFGGQRNTFKMLRQVFNFSKRERWCEANPCELLDEPKRDEQLEKPVITTETLPQYLAAVKGLDIEAAVVVSLACGLRRSEVCALSWSDIKDDGSIAITKTLHPAPGGGVYFDKTKTKNSKREIVLPDWAFERLLEINHEGDFVCMSGGQIMNPETLSRRWRAALRVAGLPYVPLKNLRHSCGTMLVREFGLSLEDAQQLLGHTTIRTTEHFYLQQSETSAKRAAAAWNSQVPKSAKKCQISDNNPNKE